MAFGFSVDFFTAGFVAAAVDDDVAAAAELAPADVAAPADTFPSFSTASIEGEEEEGEGETERRAIRVARGAAPAVVAAAVAWAVIAAADAAFAALLFISESNNIFYDSYLDN